MGNIRFAIAEMLAQLAGRASKILIRKSGETIPGRILLKLYPESIKRLAKKRIVLLVSGTNGKTSTTKYLTQMVSTLGSVTSNMSGSNLNWGVASSLMSNSPYAVLEVDELHLVNIIVETKPNVVLLLNLARDQLHRMHEVKKVASIWRAGFVKTPTSTFVIDVDDPFLNFATASNPNVIKVSFGGRHHPDASVCPSCGAYLKWSGGIYDCTCGLSNKVADKVFPNGSAGYRNSMLASVAGEVLGAAPIVIDQKKLERTVIKEINGSRAVIRLAKNPASWAEALRGIDSNYVVLILNARQVDGLDTSWLWDVDYRSLQGKKVVVCGERALDLAYRLHVEGIEFIIGSTLDEAISLFPSGSTVSAIAAYTAFFALARK